MKDASVDGKCEGKGLKHWKGGIGGRGAADGGTDGGAGVEGQVAGGRGRDGAVC